MLCSGSSCIYLISFAIISSFMINKAISDRIVDDKKFGRVDLMECALLDKSEYENRVKLGTCPRISEEKKADAQYKPEKRKKKKVETFLTKTKKVMLKAPFIAKRIYHYLELRRVDIDIELIEGLFLILRCPGAINNINNSASVSIKEPPGEKTQWFINGEEYVKTRSDWRREINPKQELEIWPIITSEDVGLYECHIDGKYRGAISISVINLTEAILQGTKHYLVTFIFATPFMIFTICHRLSLKPRDSIEFEDPTMLYYECLLNLKTQKLRTQVGSEVHGEKLERNKQKFLRRKKQGKTGNKEIVMTLIKRCEMNAEERHDIKEDTRRKNTKSNKKKSSKRQNLFCRWLRKGKLRRRMKIVHNDSKNKKNHTSNAKSPALPEKASTKTVPSGEEME